MPSEKQPHKLKTTAMVIIFIINSLCYLSAVQADDSTQMSPQAQGQNPYSRKGADTCLKCHDEYYEKHAILPIFFSKHGNRKDPRAPMAQFQCESCHGPGRAHAKEPKVGQKRAPIIAFGRESWASREKQNGQCLQCHNDGNRVNWSGSVHDNQDMYCVDCHASHARHDPILSHKKESEYCYRCHKTQRAEFARNSVHPVRYGKMKCSQCHNPHGTFTGTLLKTNTKNDTCYVCHAEKRGPYLWAHAPVSEDCGICHEPHGSLYTPLLKLKIPWLCQSCHSQSGHPSRAYDTSGLPLPGQTASPYSLAKSCLNCHYQVHGSNHPSGVKFMR